MISTRIFETALERIARITARQYGIQVNFQGSNAFTDGKTISLPSTEGLSQPLINDLNGFLDHEVAHCKFTDFSTLKRIIKGKGGQFHRQLLNAVEDVRIERLMIAEYPGCKFNIDPLNEKLIGKLVKEWSDLEKMPRLILAISFEMAGDIDFDRDAEITPYLNLIKRETAKLNRCETTDELRKLTEKITRKILKKMDDDSSKADEEKSDEGEPESGSEGKPEKSEGKSEGEPESGSEGESGEGEGESEDAGESSESTDGASTAGSGGSADTKARRMMECSAGDDSEGWSDVDLTVEDMVRNEIESEIGSEEDSESEYSDRDGRIITATTHMPFSTKFDRDIDYTGQGNQIRYNRIKGEIKKLVGPIKQQLERSLKVIENARWKSNRERGQINTRSLAQFSTDRNFRKPFKKMEKIDTNNVAVGILVDLSGSMEGDRIEMARSTAIAMAEALNELQIPFEVSGFHSKNDIKLIEAASGSDLSRFNRVKEALHKIVYKSFESTKLNGIELMSVGHQNPDGEGVRWAASRLSQQKQKRKVLIVLSDGQPATGEGDYALLRSDLRKSIKEISAYGIETVGIGIQSRSVSEYYKNHVVINNLKDLPGKTMKKLSEILRKAG